MWQWQCRRGHIPEEYPPHEEMMAVMNALEPSWRDACDSPKDWMPPGYEPAERLKRKRYTDWLIEEDRRLYDLAQAEAECSSTSSILNYADSASRYWGLEKYGIRIGTAEERRLALGGSTPFASPSGSQIAEDETAMSQHGPASSSHGEER